MTTPQQRPQVVYNAASARVGGGLSYAIRQLQSVEDLAVDVVVLASPWNERALREAVGQSVQTLRVSGAAHRFAYEQLVVPWRFRGSLLHYPGNFSPLAFGSRRSVVVVQNPNYYGAGRDYEANQSRTRRAKIALSRQSVRRADRVVTISHSLDAQLMRDVPTARGKTAVIPSGAPTLANPSRPRSDLPETFILSLANDYPHKNLHRVAEVWRESALPLPLVFAGDVSELTVSKILDSLSPEEASDVHFLGSVASPGEVSWLLTNAACMIAPSSLEAHPLTPAEAGAAGCPLVLSDIPPHREVAGANAEYVRLDAPTAAWAEALVGAASGGRRQWTYSYSWTEHGQSLYDLWSNLWKAMHA